MKSSFLQISLLTIILSCICFSCETESGESSNTPIDNTIKVRLRSEPPSLNALLSGSAYARIVHRNIYSRLAPNHPYENKYVPFLAKALPTVTPITEGELAGGKRFDFEIREEAKWDNGTPVTGNDFLFTLKCIFNPKVRTGYRGVLGFIDSVEVDPSNPKRLSIYTNRCDILAQEYLSTIEVYPAHIFDKEGLMKDIKLEDLLNPETVKELSSNENITKFAETFSSPLFGKEVGAIEGSGPYRLVEWITNEELTIEKKKDWWGDQLAAKETVFTALPEKITYKVVPDHVATTTMLKNGELDLASELPLELYSELQKNELGKEKLNFLMPEAAKYFFFQFNGQNPKLSSKFVRRAITHLVDLDEFIKTGLEGYAKRISGPISARRSYHDNSIPLPKLDLDKATQLLTQEGWTDSDEDGILDKQINGQKTDLSLNIKISPKSLESKSIAELLQINGKKVGIDFSIELKDFNKIIREDLPKGDFEIAGIGASVPPVQVDDPTLRFHTNSFPPKGLNYGHFGNAETDALIDAIVSNCDDIEARNKDYMKLQKYIADEHPMLFLYNPLETIAVSKRFEAKASEERPGFAASFFKAIK